MDIDKRGGQLPGNSDGILTLNDLTVIQHTSRKAVLDDFHSGDLGHWKD